MHIGRTIVVALLYGLGAAAIAVAVSIGLDVWRYDALSSGLTPLRFRLADVDGAEQHSFPFTTWSASHEVSLVFPTPVDSPSLRQAVEPASASVGSNAPYPSFDFEWQVLEGNEHVARGSGRNRQ